MWSPGFFFPWSCSLLSFWGNPPPRVQAGKTCMKYMYDRKRGAAQVVEMNEWGVSLEGVFCLQPLHLPLTVSPSLFLSTSLKPPPGPHSASSCEGKTAILTLISSYSQNRLRNQESQWYNPVCWQNLETWGQGCKLWSDLGSLG